MDKLEKYIRDHREAFDEGAPDPAVWEKLEHALWEEKGLGKRSRKAFHISLRVRKWVAVAAIFLLCVSFAAFVRTYQVKKEVLQQAIPSDLQEARAYYKSQIRARIARISSLEPEGAARDSSLWQLFGEDDTEYERLHDALRENPGNPHVRAAFVEYYRSRLEVLKRIEKRMEKVHP